MNNITRKFNFSRFTLLFLPLRTVVSLVNRRPRRSVALHINWKVLSLFRGALHKMEGHAPSWPLEGGRGLFLQKNIHKGYKQIVFFLILFFFLTGSELFAIKIGDSAPPFTLTSIDGKQVSLNDYKGKVIVLEWFNLECPFVQKHYHSAHMQALQEKYVAKDVVWLTINSTHPKHPNYLSPEKAKELVIKEGMHSTAMLLDPDGKVGKSYSAKSTPHMFILDKDGNLIYQGAIDDLPDPQADPKTAKNYVELALEEILNGKPPSIPETKQYGCSIKYAE